MSLKSYLSKGRTKIAAIMVVLSLFCWSGTSFADYGKSGWTIFKKAQLANSRGVTSALTRYSSLSGIFYNPALLGAKTQREAFFLSESGFAGDKLGGLMFGEPLKNGMIAGSLVGYDAGQIELNWIENGELKTENASAQRDLMGAVSYGRKINDRMLAGMTIKAASSEIAQRRSALAYAADFGMAYQANDRLTITGAVQNVGGSTKFIDKENPLPTSAYVGAGYATKIKDYQLLSGVGASYNFVDETYAPEFGVELRYSFLSLNAGYRFNAKETNLSFGLGVVWDNIEFGYAYVPGVYLDTTHRMNVSYKFRTAFTRKQPEAAAPRSITKPAVKQAAPVKPAVKSVTKSPSKTLKTVN